MSQWKRFKRFSLHLLLVDQ